MFTDVKKPFYQSAEFMHLEDIPENEYFDFIKARFEKGSILIKDNAIYEILKLTNCPRNTYPPYKNLNTFSLYVQKNTKN